MDRYLLVHDVYPEVLAATGFLTQNSIIFRILARLFSATFRLFGTIIVLGRDMQLLVQEKLRGAERRVVIIPNWGDFDEIKPIPREHNPFLIENEIDTRIIIQFSGNIGRTHDVETLLKVAKRLQNRDDILFLFVGYGGKTDLITGAVGEGALPNVRFLHRQPRELLGPMLASSTATIISFVESMKGISVPSRMYNVMAAGTPIIAMADPDSELALVVRDEEAGWVLKPGDVEGLEQLIEHIAGPDGELEGLQRGARGRAKVVATYALAGVIKQYKSLLQNYPM